MKRNERKDGDIYKKKKSDVVVVQLDSLGDCSFTTTVFSFFLFFLLWIENYSEGASQIATVTGDNPGGGFRFIR